MVSALFTLIWSVVAKKYNTSDPLLSKFYPTTLYIGYTGITGSGLSRLISLSPFESSDPSYRHDITNYGISNVYSVDLTPISDSDFSSTFQELSSADMAFQRDPESPASIVSVKLLSSEFPAGVSSLPEFYGYKWNVKIIADSTVPSGTAGVNIDTTASVPSFEILVPVVDLPLTFNVIVLTNSNGLPISFHITRAPVTLTSAGEFVNIEAYLYTDISYIVNPETATSGTVNILTVM